MTPDTSHYTLQDAEHYAAHHEKNLRTTLTTWRERRLLTRGLVQLGSHPVVLDAPCGTGRFWPALFAAGARDVLAVDNSAGMLAVARARWPATAPAVRLLESSLFALDLPDASVDVVSCMRFFHHLSHSEDRARALREVRRVARHGAVLSLWVDGNLQARRRRRSQPRPDVAGYGPRRFLPRAQFESELLAAGFHIHDRLDLARGLSMWRFYVLRCA